MQIAPVGDLGEIPDGRIPKFPQCNILDPNEIKMDPIWKKTELFHE